jgi:hypothetical protein
MVFLETSKTAILLFITWWIQVKFLMLESSLAITSSSSFQMSLEEHFNTSQSYQNFFQSVEGQKGSMRSLVHISFNL